MSSFLRIVILFILLCGLFATPGHAALIWKDDFSEELIYELTWDTRASTGTPVLADKRCVLSTSPREKIPAASIRTQESRALPENFDLVVAMEFTHVVNSQAQFVVRLGAGMELVVNFGRELEIPDEDLEGQLNIIFMQQDEGNGLLKQAGKAPSWFPHQIKDGERFFITWQCNGQTPAMSFIKFGRRPGESHVAEFLIETPKPATGTVEIGLRGGPGEVRLNEVRAYLYGTSSSMVHDWVLF